MCEADLFPAQNPISVEVEGIKSEKNLFVVRWSRVTVKIHILDDGSNKATKKWCDPEIPSKDCRCVGNPSRHRCPSGVVCGDEIRDQG